MTEITTFTLIARKNGLVRGPVSDDLLVPLAVVFPKIVLLGSK